jgi:hypothetical protein
LTATRVERGTLDAVVRARDSAIAATTAEPAARGWAENVLTQAVGRLFALAEAYPALRASGNFLALQGELSGTEDRIAYAWQFYNSAVQTYNAAYLVALLVTRPARPEPAPPTQDLDPEPPAVAGRPARAGNRHGRVHPATTHATEHCPVRRTTNADLPASKASVRKDTDVAIEVR